MIKKYLNLDHVEVRGRKMVERKVHSTDRIADREGREDDRHGLNGLAHGHSGT